MKLSEQLKSISEDYLRLATDLTFLPEHHIPLDLNGDSVDLCHHAFILGLKDIDCFVCEVLCSSALGFFEIANKKRLTLKKLPLSKYFILVQDYFELYSPDYQYSPRVSLYFDCCFKLGLGIEYFFDPKRHSTNSFVRQYELFNQLIECIRNESKGEIFRSRMRYFRERPNDRMASGRKFIDAIFDYRSRVDVLRIDFAYRYEIGKDIVLSRAKQDLKRFFGNRRHKPSLFKDFLGAIWRLEWAPLKGYHFHLILFYKNIHPYADAHRAFALIDYWKTVITKGAGLGFNCNAMKYKYKRLGIGRVERHDQAKRKVLIEDVLSYLTKNDQYLLAKSLAKEITFATTVPPVRRKSRGNRSQAKIA